MLTYRQVKKWQAYLLQNDRKGLKELQQIWTKDMLAILPLSVVFAWQQSHFQLWFISVAICVALLVVQIWVWGRRIDVFPTQYTWWHKWCVYLIAPYDVVVFVLFSWLFLRFAF